MQLLLIGAAALGGWYCWRTLKRELARLDREEKAVGKPPAEKLERDPQTGRYRVDKKD